MWYTISLDADPTGVTMQYQAPFISYTAPDDAGVRAQVKVETGVLPIKSIEDAGRMKKVTFDIAALGNAKLKRDPYANISPTEAAYAEALASFKAGVPVAFRIEAQRKASLRLSRKTPLAALNAQTETVRCLVAINTTRTGEALTSPAEDANRVQVSPEDAPDYLTDTAPTVGIDEHTARDIHTRVCATQGAESQSAIAVAAVLAIFGIDVYQDAA